MTLTEAELKKAKSLLPVAVFRSLKEIGLSVLKDTIWTLNQRIVLIHGQDADGNFLAVSRSLTEHKIKVSTLLECELYLGRSQDLSWLMTTGYTYYNYITRVSDKQVFEVVSLGSLVELRHMPRRGLPNNFLDIQIVTEVIRSYRQANSTEYDIAQAAERRLYAASKKKPVPKKPRAVKEPPASVKTKYQMMLED